MSVQSSLFHTVRNGISTTWVPAKVASEVKKYKDELSKCFTTHSDPWILLILSSMTAEILGVSWEPWELCHWQEQMWWNEEGSRGWARGAATTVLWVRSQRGADAQPWLTHLISLLTISAPLWDSSDLITYLMWNSASPCELLHFLNSSYVVEAQHFTGLVLPWELISLCLNRAFNIQIILYDKVVLDNKPSYSIELQSHKKIIVSHF